ncbi:MAG: hypothetical protein AB1778_10070 [Candidatus Bipolaricaulota bacterium]
MRKTPVIAAVAAACLVVAAAASAQTLSGSWDTSVTIVPSPVSLSLESNLTVNYAVGDWTFASKTVALETGWFDQQFTATGVLGGFTVGSTLDLDPDNAAFDRWELFSGTVLADIAFDVTFTLLPGDLQVRLSGTGTIEALRLTAAMTFGATGGGCDLDWVGASLTGSFTLCCADVDAVLALNCSGFDQLCFTAQGLAIAAIPWAMLDVELCFTPQTKTLVVEPRFDFGASGCFEVYLSDPAGGALLGDVTIDAVGLECTIGGIEFYGISWLGTGSRPSLLSGTPYWEAYRIRTSGPDCCGPFSFDVTVYFLDGGTRLFDLAFVEAELEIRLAAPFTFRTGVEFDFEQSPAFAEWTLGFLVVW